MISKELRNKIKDYKSNSSEGEYHFSISKYKNLIKDSKNVNHISAFGSPSNDQLDPDLGPMQAFKTTVQSTSKLSFNDIKRPNLSDFGKTSKFDQFQSVPSKAQMSKINKLAKNTKVKVCVNDKYLEIYLIIRNILTVKIYPN